MENILIVAQKFVCFFFFYNFELTSFSVSSEVISVRVWNVILRPGFFCAIIQLTNSFRNYEIETLASVFLSTHKQALVSYFCHRLLIDVSLQHHTKNGQFSSTLLFSRKKPSSELRYRSCVNTAILIHPSKPEIPAMTTQFIEI